MTLTRRHAAIPGILLALAVLLAAREFERGRRGPTPDSTPESMAAGRELLALMLDATGARWTTQDTVAFVVTSERFGRPGAALAMRLDPISRVMVIAPPAAGEPTRVFNPADDSIVPPAGKELRTLLPSINFWTLAPGVFDDPTVVLWRLPDVGGRSRVAARWPGEADWFILETAADSNRFESVEFVDARFGVFLRWRGRYDGPLGGGAAPLPRYWGFRPAAPLLDLLVGRRDVVGLTWNR